MVVSVSFDVRVPEGVTREHCSSGRARRAATRLEEGCVEASAYNPLNRAALAAHAENVRIEG